MAHLDLSHVDLTMRRILGIRLQRTHAILVAAAACSPTIVAVAAAMMVRI
jgi:hypothetical protein